MGIYDPLFKHPFSGGSGDSMPEAVVIELTTSEQGIAAQSEWIQRRCGRKHVDWHPEECQLWICTDKKGDRSTYDIVTIRLADGTKRKYFFNITNFYGKS